MAAGDPDLPAEPANESALGRLVLYFRRATLLRCPMCGTKPIFKPWHQVRNLHDWLTPLDGCPRDGFPYEREPGYFLMSVWAIGYGVSAVVGILVFVYLQIWHSDLPLAATLVLVALPLPFVNMLFARHAKAYFLAIDLFCDPPGNGDEDDDGGGWNSGVAPRPGAAPKLEPIGSGPGDRGGRAPAPAEPVTTPVAH